MIYVVRCDDGRFYRRGKLVRSRLAASFGYSPSGVRGILERARAAFPERQWQAVPFRDACDATTLPIIWAGARACPHCDVPPGQPHAESCPRQWPAINATRAADGVSVGTIGHVAPPGFGPATDALGVRVLDDTQRLDWLSGLPEEDASLARNPSGLWGVTVKRDGVDHLLGVGKTPREALDDAHGVDLPHGGQQK